VYIIENIYLFMFINMITYGDSFIYRFEDPYINKHNKEDIDAIGGNFAGHVSKESTQTALDAFHSIGSSVKSVPTKALIEQLTSSKTILKENKYNIFI